jgi:hypothetical protein
LLCIASGRMHEQDDVPLGTLVPDVEARRAIVRECAEAEGKEVPEAAECRYVPARSLMYWLGKRLRRDAK